MSEASRSWSWRHAILKSELPATTRHVLLTLSCYMNDVGGGCYPTTLDLAAATGLSQRAVCTHILAAKSAGWLRVSEHGFRGQKWKNHQYEAAWPKLEGAEPASVPLASEGTERGSVRDCEGTEPNDAKALNEVQSTTPATTPMSSNEDNRRTTPRDELLQVLDSVRADAVLEHRKKMGRPMTARAAKLTAAKFAQCPDPNAAADAMIANGWQGFELKWLENRQGNTRSGTTKPSGGKPRTVVDAVKARLQELELEGDRNAIEHQH